MKRSILTFFFFFVSSFLLSAQDLMTGTWYAKHTDEEIKLPFEIKMEIGQGEKQMLYPVRMTISNADFEGVFQFLLLKKSIRTYAISSAKFTEKSYPFTISALMRQFAGLLQTQTDLKGNTQLELERISFHKSIAQKDVTVTSNANYKNIYQSLEELILSTPVFFQKLNDVSWNHPDADSLLQPRLTPLYMGVYDTIFVYEKKLLMNMNVNKDIDIVSCRLLKNPVWDQVDSKKKREEEVVMLDTGLNILGFFADDFGKTGFSTASMEFGSEIYSKKMDFGARGNEGFTFLAQKIYYRMKEEDMTRFDELPGFDNKTNITYTSVNRNEIPGLPANKNIKTIGTLRSKSNKLKFAIWDDAVEDGDTISIMVNGVWVASGFPVKKRPQFIEVELKPGSNSIIFQADNLGSIVPNTSVVEVIDGNKRKSYFIETDLDHMNRINILFDVPK